jgi:HD domain
MKAQSAERFEWRRRRVASFMVRACTIVVPVALAIVVSIVLGKILPTATTWVPTIARIAVIVITTTIVMRAASKQMQRLMPLAIMLRLSWAFPDEAPGRFSTALRHARYKEAPNGAVDPEASVTVTDHLLDLVRQINVHHRATRGHSERVRAYADLLGEEMGLTTDERDKLCWAALLHDIGKVEVPVDILDYPGKPSPEQWSVLAAHPAHGQTLTSPVSGWLGAWASGIWEHHERWDGTGYPAKVANSSISLSGRIVAVADAFETMTAVRAYKRPMSIEAAREELVASAGSHFDPAVVRAFLAIGLIHINKANGWASYIQAPLVFLSQAGEAAKVLLRTAASGSTAVAAVAAGSVVAGPMLPVSQASEPPPPVEVVVTSTLAPQSPVILDGSGALPAQVEAAEVVVDTTVESPPVTEASTTTTVPPTTTTVQPTTTTRPAATTVAVAVPVPPAPTNAPVTTQPVPVTTIPRTTTTVAQTTTTSPKINVTTTVAPDTTAAKPPPPPPNTPSTITTVPATTTTTTIPVTTTRPPATTTTVAVTTTTAASVVANPDTFSITAGVWTVIDPLANDLGPIDPRSIEVVSFVGAMQISINNGVMSVRAPNGHAGQTKYVNYLVCNASELSCAEAQITLLVI